MGRRPKQEKNVPIKIQANGNLPHDSKKSIAAVFLMVFCLISLLALFNLAGDWGNYLIHFLRISIGWLAFATPFIFALTVILALKKENGWTGSKIFGFILTIIAICGFFQWLAAGPNNLNLNITDGGGLIGVAVQLPLFKAVSFWAAGIIIIALMLIGIIIFFQTNFYNLIAWFRPGTFASKLEQKTINNVALGQPWPITPTSAVEPIKNLAVSESGLISKALNVGKKININQINSEPITKHNIEIPLTLLDINNSKATSRDINQGMQIIKTTLDNFGIPVEMGEVNVGPTITQFTFKPSEGIKISRITALHNDLAMALAAHPIRIEAPIPGKSLVGVEVPNQAIAMVKLREILESDNFKNHRGKLKFALGKDVSGKPWVADLATMPHLLVAGATGSGKSVCIHNIILSFLFTHGPDICKFILVDHKRVELTAYNDIPHLLTPVITDIPKTINALKWAVVEMDRRYKILEAASKKNITSYNEGVLINKLPYIIIIIDEMGDLMLSAGKEVEALVIRLAQLARAVGIHLIFATQRPSVNIITGTIKANLPARIALSVISSIDSRTILDEPGADKLLGRGDMLFLTAELGKPVRLQGAYVSEAEMEKVTNFIRKEGRPDYNMDIIEKHQVAGINGGNKIFNSEDGDPLLEQARDIVIKAQKASVTLLQRHLRLGYSRAAFLIDKLEQEGTIGPGQGAKPREVLLNQWPDGQLLEDNETSIANKETNIDYNNDDDIINHDRNLSSL
jgi:S-DNA-T family DNA segregation ATPase FtsK/SpoIIIE